MATIKINNLNPTGSELLFDSESFLNELTDEEMNMTNGGSSPICISIGVSLGIWAWSQFKGCGRK